MKDVRIEDILVHDRFVRRLTLQLMGDAATAEADLTAMLNRQDTGAVDGALLFSCTGRGSAIFPDAGHDVRAVRRLLGVSGVGGIFADGEIGPVAGRNHVHGFTASILAFGRR